MRHPRSAPVALAILTLGVSSAALAGPLKVVNVGYPAHHYVFSPAGYIVVQDTSDTFAVSGAAGLARLQARTTQGLPGAPAAGLYSYAYRLIMTDVAGTTFTPCVKSMTIKFGAIVSTLDHDGDGVAGDQMFVATSGAIGSVGIAAAVQVGSYVTVFFEGAGVCGGSGAGTGDSSFFFGLVSARSPKFVTATILDDSSTTYMPQARAPKSFSIVPGDYWHAKLQDALQPSTAMDLELSIDTARESRFGGTLRVRDGSDREPIAIPVEGTLSGRGQMQIVGRTKGARFMASLTAQDGDELFSGRCRLVLAKGGSTEGTLWLAEDPRLLPTPSIQR